MKRRLLIHLSMAAAACVALAAVPSGAAEYPTKTIHVVVPWKAGGGTDTIARGFTAAMEKFIDQSIVIDNISGASSATGNLKVARAKPDGYTVLLNGSGEINVNLVFKNLPFSLDSYKYAGGFFSTPTYVLSHKDRPYRDLGHFLEMAKAKPGTLTAGTTGAANAHFLMAQAMRGITGINFRIIPYQGGGPLKKALIGNQVDIGIIHSPVLLKEVKVGLIKVLASAGSLKLIQHPPIQGMKTLRDYNIPIDIGTTRGLFVPKDTPQAIVDKLTEIAEKAAKSKQFEKFAKRFGFAPIWLTPKQFEALNRRELATYMEIKRKHIDKK